MPKAPRTPIPAATAVDGALVQQLKDRTQDLALMKARYATAMQMLGERDGAIINLRTDLQLAHNRIAEVEHALQQAQVDRQQQD